MSLRADQDALAVINCGRLLALRQHMPRGFD